VQRMLPESERQWERIAYLLREGRLTRRELLQVARVVMGTAAFAAVAAACGRQSSAAVTLPDVTGIEEPIPVERRDIFEHVQQPTRLQLVSESVAVSGVVERVTYNPYDGDHKVYVKLDPQYEHLLRPSNNGLLVAEVIATDEPTVYIPQPGEHATFHGPLVLDRGHDHWVEIHPCWLITTDSITGPLEPRRTLRVEVEASEEVVVGRPWPVAIRVVPAHDGDGSAVNGVHLFLELISAVGVTVRWKAARTNMLGEAVVRLASLVRAGEYTLYVHAAKGQDMGEAEIRLRVRRR